MRSNYRRALLVLVLVVIGKMATVWKRVTFSDIRDIAVQTSDQAMEASTEDSKDDECSSFHEIMNQFYIRLTRTTQKHYSCFWNRRTQAVLPVLVLVLLKRAPSCCLTKIL